MSKAFDSSRRFYDAYVAEMIKDIFSQYEDRIAVGIAGEGSDCFGYDDFMSRDHDFGTGVCLWLDDDDMKEFGNELSESYNMLVKESTDTVLTARLSERRGVMTIHDYYSNILGVDCDVKCGILSEEKWLSFDHACLATAVNGEVFRDDKGIFTSFRELLLDYYPENVWRIRIAGELHKFSAALQVNYARCMTRDDVVAARLCQMQGLEAAMELFFLMNRCFAPYYKWTYRRLCELDIEGRYASLIRELSDAPCDRAAWTGKRYSANYINMGDTVIVIAEQLAKAVVRMMKEHNLIGRDDPYLELYVNEVLN